MHDMLSHLMLGFSAALSLQNLALCFVGAFVGTLVGVLPGLGPLATIAILLPLSIGLPPLGALIMLAGVYYGAQYGGSTTSILVNVPGEASSVVTALDGHQMAKQGKAGVALATAAVGSFAAGCAATLLVAFFSKPMASVALSFGPWEYFSLVALAFACAVAVASDGGLKGYAMLLFGVLLSMVGIDQQSRLSRMTLGIPELYDGIGVVVVAMGIFGFSEILRILTDAKDEIPALRRIESYWPNREDGRRALGAIFRGTGIGALLGMLPGGGAIVASFAAYAAEKGISKEPERFGKGAIEGVAAPESANNAAAQTSFVPLLALGVPSNAVVALMGGALTIHGIVPGPNIMDKQPVLFWGLVASMWIGNLMLLVINLPLIRLWVLMLRIPYRLLFPLIVLFCCIGLFASDNSTFDILAAGAFGLLGYWLMRLGYEPAPLIFGMVLGPLLEEHLHRALILGQGDLLPFVARPVSCVLLIAAIAVMLLGFARKPHTSAALA